MSRVSGAVELTRVMILAGEYAPGERIVEVLLAERLRVGRSTVREALRRLEGEGLLEADDAGGMHVIVLDPRTLAATLELRATLEALTAGLAARRAGEGRATPTALRELGDLAEAAAAATSGADALGAVIADRHLHRAVAALAANGPARDALHHVWDRIVVAAARGLLRPDRADAADREHRDLLAAITAGDEDEASAIAHRHARTPQP